MVKATLSNCHLCSNEAICPIVDENKVFCCPGCQAVFNLLSAKNALLNFQDHPIFKQAVKGGLISNPALLEQIRNSQPSVPEEEWQKLHIEITDMWCPSCAEVIKLFLIQEKGVRCCFIDYTTDLASIEFSPRHTSKEQIFAIIASIGYHAVTLEDHVKKAVSFDLYFRFIIAAFFSLNIMMFSYPIYASYFDIDLSGYAHLFSWLSLLAALPVVFYSGYPIIRRFWTSLSVGIVGMEALVVISVSAAMGLSIYELLIGTDRVYFDSLSVIITFVLLGKIIESRAKFSSKNALLRLTRALPRRGRKRFSDNSERFVSLKEVSIGDLLVAFAGEKIVMDGTVIEGKGHCDESIMTGESWPQSKLDGSLVLAGSILQHGRLVYKVTKSSEETALHKILETLEKDIGHKSVYVRSADSVVRWFVPFVVVIALSTAIFCWMMGITDLGKSVVETAIIRAVSILLISCPCAIGIAAPLAEAHLMNGLACLGAIVRNRGCLAKLGKETVFVFDKTGTVTHGQFSVLAGLDALSSEQLSILKGMASQSTHPISMSIAKSIKETGLKIFNIAEFAGKGVRAQIGDDHYVLGSAQFAKESGVDGIEECSLPPNDVVSDVYFCQNAECLAKLSLGDKIREDASDTIKSLPEKTILLSGDSPSVVSFVAKQCLFDHWYARCNPFQKKQIITDLREENHIVCMLGDGINDSLALAEAHIGISVVSATDISIQVSDILLTTDRLDVIPKLRNVAQQGRKIIKQNLFWAFAYNVLGIGLAMGGLLSPIFAAFAMVASSIIVLFNAQRIKVK